MGKNKFFDITMLKYGLVGIINTLVGNGVMFILHNCFNVNFWWSNISNVVVGSIVSYFLNKYFTFKSKNKGIKEKIIFALNIIVCHFTSYGVAQPLALLIFSNLDKKLQTNLAMLIGAGLFIVLNYLGQRFIVFKNKQDGKKYE